MGGGGVLWTDSGEGVLLMVVGGYCGWMMGETGDGWLGGCTVDGWGGGYCGWMMGANCKACHHRHGEEDMFRR